MAIDVTSLLSITGDTLTLDAGSGVGDLLRDQLARLTQGLPPVVRSAVRTVADGSVTVTGNAELLGVASLPITVTAEAGAASPALTVRLGAAPLATGTTLPLS